MRDRRTPATTRQYFLPVCLVVVVLGVYSPVLQFEFLDWDDGPDIYQNQFVTSPGGYREAWRS